MINFFSQVYKVLKKLKMSKIGACIASFVLYSVQKAKKRTYLQQFVQKYNCDMV